MTAKKIEHAPFWQGIVILMHIMTGIASLALLVMAAVTCLDIVLRLVGYPQKGAYDIVRITGVLAVACALPLTTALKGHVAIEYFFHRMNRLWRAAVDAVMRIVMIVGFFAAAFGCLRYGLRFLRSGEVSATLEIPLFWVPWVMAFAFTVTALIVVFHLLYPKKELIKQ
jgi:TRAP-type C4-dicarboxylate transport system permease small subunit